MKTFRRITASFLCALMILCAAPVGALADIDFSGLFDFKAEAAERNGTCGDNLTWTLNDTTGELIIEGTGDMYTDTSWYNLRSSIKTVKIGDGVTSISRGS